MTVVALVFAGCALLATTDAARPNLQVWIDDDLRQALADYTTDFDMPSAPVSDYMTFSERLRAPFAALGMDAWNAVIWRPWPIHPGIIVGAHVFAWLLAVVAAPFAAAGYDRRRCFGVALKLALWSAALWIPGMLLAALLMYVRAQLLTYRTELAPLMAAVVALTAAGWVLLYVRALAYAVGRPRGADRAPPSASDTIIGEDEGVRCAECGYQLTGLRSSSRCPECAFPIAVSVLPGQVVPDWEKARLARRLLGWGATTWQVLRGPAFFGRMAVANRLTAPLGYVLVTALVACVPAWIFQVAHLDYATRDWDALATAAATCVAIAGGAVVAGVLVTLAATAGFSRGGKRAPRTAWSAACYGSAWLLVIVAVGYVAAAVAAWTDYPWRNLVSLDMTDWLDAGAALLSARGVVAVFDLGLALAFAYFCLRRYRGGVQAALRSETLAARAEPSR